MSCSFPSTLGEQGGPKRECVRLAHRSRLCCDLGAASDFLKNDFNQVRPLPVVGEGRLHPLGKGRGTWGSVLRPPPSAGVLGPLASLPAPWSPGLCAGGPSPRAGPGSPAAGLAAWAARGQPGSGAGPRLEGRVAREAPGPRPAFLPPRSCVYNFANE